MLHCWIFKVPCSLRSIPFFGSGPFLCPCTTPVRTLPQGKITHLLFRVLHPIAQVQMLFYHFTSPLSTPFLKVFKVFLVFLGQFLFSSKNHRLPVRQSGGPFQTPSLQSLNMEASVRVYHGSGAEVKGSGSQRRNSFADILRLSDPFDRR